MRVLIVNTSEQTGGAAIAARRLMEALIAHGVKAKMLVRDKQSETLQVCQLPLPRWRLWLTFVADRLGVLVANRFSTHNLWKIDCGGCGTDITRLPEFREADIIHLHWVNQGMLSLSDMRRILSSGKKVVWTLHDLWPLCGVCHHPLVCERYKDLCHDCPLLAHPSANDLSAKVFRQKRTMYEGAPLHLVAVSQWVAQMARASALTRYLPVTVINNTLDINRFTLGDKTTARQKLGIAQSHHVIAFGAARIDDPIKDFGMFVEALHELTNNEQANDGQTNNEQAYNGHGMKKDDVMLLLFGQCKDKTILSRIPVAYKYLEYVEDTTLIYQAADCIVSSSHRETFGQTMAEAQACGAVPVTFAGGGQEDIIDHLQNGYLAQQRTAEALAEGIAWALSCAVPPETLHAHAVHHFSPETIAMQHIRLYEELLTSNPHKE